MLISPLILFLGTLIASSTCILSTPDKDAGNVMILSNDNFSTITSAAALEFLVETKCKKYSAGLQDQIDELKIKVDKIEITKNQQNSHHSHDKGMKKRDIPKALKGICSTSSSLCTHYHPDHPDATSKKGKYSPTVTNEMLANNMTGIPTSCKDLQQLGHSINGLYLIKKLLPNNQDSKIETVHCDFKSTSPALAVNQDVIGDVDVKTKSVHFYVQRDSEFDTAGAVIPFKSARLNEANAFNLTSGIFTAPVPGIYHFQFTGLKRWNADVSVFIQLNGNNIGETYSSFSGTHESLSLSSSLRLVENDKVNLLLKSGTLYDSISGLTHFSGWLVKEFLK